MGNSTLPNLRLPHVRLCDPNPSTTPLLPLTLTLTLPNPNPPLTLILTLPLPLPPTPNRLQVRLCEMLAVSLETTYFKQHYLRLTVKIHPDKCSDPRATLATQLLNGAYDAATSARN